MATIKHNGWTIVDGVLSLPDGSHVLELDLDSCRSLTALSRGLTVGLSLFLGGCTELKSLPSGLIVFDSLYLTGCTSLTALPEGLIVGGWLVTTNFDYHAKTRLLTLEIELPESVIAGMVGMRVCQIIDHPWIRDLGLAEMIVAVAKSEDGQPFLTLEPPAALECAA